MSIKLMAQVWEIELSHSQQAVLLAMADFANDDGRNCYPSHKLLAWKTGYSERQIARLINELIAEGVVKIIKPATNKQPPRYWIQLEKGKPKPPFGNDSFLDDESGGVILSPQENGGDKMSPQDRSRDDKMSPQNGSRLDKMSPQNVEFVTPRGDIAMSPDPSVNHQYKQPTKKQKGNDGAAPSPPLDSFEEFLQKLCFICHGHKETTCLTAKDIGSLRREAKKIRGGGFTVADLRTWMTTVWFKDWRWEKGQQRPRPDEVRSSIPSLRAESYDEPVRKEYGKYTTYREAAP